MSELIQKVFLVSRSTCLKIRERFPAFFSSEIANGDETNEIDPKYKQYKTGPYLTRTVERSHQDNGTEEQPDVFCVSQDGGLVDGYGAYNSSWYYVRFEILVPYDKTSDIVKNCKMVDRAGPSMPLTYSTFNKTPVIETSTAPIVPFGNLEYIWLNKQECETGKNNLMDLVVLKLHLKNYPQCGRFASENLTYETATSLHDQMRSFVRSNCTEKEWEMIVPAKINKDSQKVTPVAEQAPKQKADPNGSGK